MVVVQGAALVKDQNERREAGRGRWLWERRLFIGAGWAFPGGGPTATAGIALATGDRENWRTRGLCGLILAKPPPASGRMRPEEKSDVAVAPTSSSPPADAPTAGRMRLRGAPASLSAGNIESRVEIKADVEGHRRFRGWGAGGAPPCGSRSRLPRRLRTNDPQVDQPLAIRHLHVGRRRTTVSFAPLEHGFFFSRHSLQAQGEKAGHPVESPCCF